MYSNIGRYALMLYIHLMILIAELIISVNTWIFQKLVVKWPPEVGKFGKPKQIFIFSAKIPFQKKLIVRFASKPPHEFVLSGWTSFPSTSRPVQSHLDVRYIYDRIPYYYMFFQGLRIKLRKVIVWEEKFKSI